MTPQSPTAFRPLVLLTLAVLVAHLVLLDPTPRHRPAASPPLRSLVTRVLMIAPPSQSEAIEQKQAGLAAAPQRRPARPAIEPPGRPPVDAARADAAAAPRPIDGVAGAAPDRPPEPGSAINPPVQPMATVDATPSMHSASASPQASAGDLAFAIPGSVRLRYAVAGQSRGQDWSVEGELLWRHDGNEYQASLQYSASPLRSRLQHSAGRITAEGLAPRRFSDQRRSEQATHFERETGRLVFSNNAPSQALAPGMQDRLSVFVQLAAMVAAAPSRFPAGSEITLPTAGTRDAQLSRFKVQGDEVLALPGGSVETRKLVRDPLGEYEPRVEIWLGTGMDYMPVRIRLTQPNGDYVDQQWSSTDRP